MNTPRHSVKFQWVSASDYSPPLQVTSLAGCLILMANNFFFPDHILIKTDNDMKEY